MKMFGTNDYYEAACVDKKNFILLYVHLHNNNITNIMLEPYGTLFKVNMKDVIGVVCSKNSLDYLAVEVFEDYLSVHEASQPFFLFINKNIVYKNLSSETDNL